MLAGNQIIHHNRRVGGVRGAWICVVVAVGPAIAVRLSELVRRGRGANSARPAITVRTDARDRRRVAVVGTRDDEDVVATRHLANYS